MSKIKSKNWSIAGGVVKATLFGDRYEVRINNTQFGWCDNIGEAELLVESVKALRKAKYGEV